MLVALGILVELVEVDEELAEAFLRHSHAIVNYPDLDVYETLLAFNDGLIRLFLLHPVLFDLLHEVHFQRLINLVELEHLFLRLLHHDGLSTQLLIDNFYQNRNFAPFICEFHRIAQKI